MNSRRTKRLQLMSLDERVTNLTRDLAALTDVVAAAVEIIQEMRKG